MRRRSSASELQMSAPLSSDAAPGPTPARTAASRRVAAPGASFLVAAGILLSRVVGLVRERVFAHYFGTSVAGDAFKAALKIPNVLQALFGEGALSASFIPVYAGLLAREEKDEARRVAGAVFATLALVVSVLVLLFVLITPWIIATIAPGFTGAKRELTITLVRILWPSAGLFVLGAWCLGVLNSHRKFFLSYAWPGADGARWASSRCSSPGAASRARGSRSSCSFPSCCAWCRGCVRASTCNRPRCAPWDGTSCPRSSRAA